MRKIRKIAILFLISYILAFFVGYNKSLAIKLEEEPTYLTIYRKIKNAEGKITNAFSYKIEPVEGNPATVDGFPTEAVINFDNEYENGVAIATNIIDFSNVEFSEKGKYKYKIYEVSSENSELYPVDEKNSYEIFFLVTERDGTDVVTMLGVGEHYVENVDQKEKMEIEFSSEIPVKEPEVDDNKNQNESKDNNFPKDSKVDEASNDEQEHKSIIENIINTISPKTGDMIILYVVIIAITVCILVFVFIKKRNNKNDESDFSEEEEFLDDVEGDDNKK